MANDSIQFISKGNPNMPMDSTINNCHMGIEIEYSVHIVIKMVNGIYSRYMDYIEITMLGEQNPGEISFYLP